MAYAPHSDEPLRGNWGAALGAAVLAASAAFFALQWLWQPAIGQYVARAVVEQEPSHSGDAPPLDIADARAALTGEKSLTQAAASVPANDLPPQALRQSLSVYRAYDAHRPRAARLAIEFRDSQESRALAVVSSLSGEFLRQQTPADSSGKNADATTELTAAQARLTAARAAEDAARRVLDVLVKEHFDSLRAASAHVPADLPPRKTIAPARQFDAHDAERRLAQAEMTRLQQQRAALLAQLTTQHPRVLHLDDEIAAAQSRLNEIPAPNAPEPVDDHLSPPEPQVAPPVQTADLIDTVRTLAGSRERFRTALEQYESARTRRLEAEAVVEVLSQPTASLASQPVARFWLADPPQIVAREPVLSPLVRLALVALASAVAGFVALLALRPRLAPTALHSAADIEAALGLPVIAQLPGRRTRAA